jgi:hypothetical protein
VFLGRQERAHWCWAAVASSVAEYYHGSRITQTEVCRLVLNVDIHSSAITDCPGYMDEALIAVGCFSNWSPGRPTFERIRQELCAGRPICVCIEWRRGGAHYVLITGAFPESGEIYVQDPEQGSSIQMLSDFPAKYRQGGWWRGVYWTDAHQQRKDAFHNSAEGVK